MISTLQATTFHRFMANGRTSPALCSCEDSVGNVVGDYLVKLRGGMERGAIALASELVASRLASYFAISVPEPALVHIEADFAQQVVGTEPSHAKLMQASIGLNFGSRYLTHGVTWPVDKSIPEAMWTSAVSIFAFDALIQNPDRKFRNPNLLGRGDELFLFDHELAFSFIEALFPQAEPWRLAQFDLTSTFSFAL